MWCERIVRTLVDFDPDAPSSGSVDCLDINWNQCDRVLKGSSRQGEEVRILLRPGQRLAHGDVLFEDADRVLVINVRPCEVVVVRTETAGAMARLALELGNLHWPTQINDADIVFPEDGPVMEVLAKLNLRWTKEFRRFVPEAVSAGATVKLSTGFEVIRRGKSGA